MSYDINLSCYIIRGGRLVAKPVIAKVGSHALFFQAPAFAPVLYPPAAWLSKEVINEPEDDHGTKVRERIFYPGTKQAADSNEKENKK